MPTDDPIILNPPTKPKLVTLTADASQWHRKWSTWLASLSASCAAGAGAFMLMPQEWKALFPSWLGVGFVVVGVVSAALVPLATSLSQKSLQK